MSEKSRLKLENAFVFQSCIKTKSNIERKLREYERKQKRRIQKIWKCILITEPVDKGKFDNEFRVDSKDSGSLWILTGFQIAQTYRAKGSEHFMLLILNIFTLSQIILVNKKQH